MTIALERGELFSHGKRLALYDAATETVFSPTSLTPPQRRAIEKALGLKPTYRIRHNFDTISPTFSPKTPQNTHQNEAPEKTKKGRFTKENQLREASQNDPEPPQNTHLGDKTPAWAAWLQRTNPEAFATRYRLDTAFPRLSPANL